MKRLIRFIKAMLPNDDRYTDMYEGPVPVQHYEKLEIHSDPTYWHEDIAFTVTRTHRLTPEKPCVAVKIPFSRLGIPMGTDPDTLADFLLRRWNREIEVLNAVIANPARPDRENGKFYSFRPTGAVLRRNASYIEDLPEGRFVCLLTVVQLPVKKHDKAVRMLCRMLPEAAENLIAGFEREALRRALALREKQREIRRLMREEGWCAFVADGSVLPRKSGTEEPLPGARPFVSPPEMAQTLAGVRGMAMKNGVHVVAGGGYSGKSTFLAALSAGIYDHIEGDGRELALTDQSAMEVGAEEGRAVSGCDITPFIRWIPGGDPAAFSTEHASGSTSQAAAILEAVHCGCRLLLIDEDRSAANFMIRDRRMRALVRHEPVIPFTERVRELFEREGVSTILVVGGSGEYLPVADRVIRMDAFAAEDATAEARAIAPEPDMEEIPPPAVWRCRSTLAPEGFSSYPPGERKERCEVAENGFLMIGGSAVDARALYNLASPAQLRAAGLAIRTMMTEHAGGPVPLDGRIDEVLLRMERDGVDIVFSALFAGERWLELPRRQEVFALVSRLRGVRFIDE